MKGEVQQVISAAASKGRDYWVVSSNWQNYFVVSSRGSVQVVDASRIPPEECVVRTGFSLEDEMALRQIAESH